MKIKLSKEKRFLMRYDINKMVEADVDRISGGILNIALNDNAQGGYISYPNDWMGNNVYIDSFDNENESVLLIRKKKEKPSVTKVEGNIGYFFAGFTCATVLGLTIASIVDRLHSKN